jgi:hypothetical protein
LTLYRTKSPRSEAHRQMSPRTNAEPFADGSLSLSKRQSSNSSRVGCARWRWSCSRSKPNCPWRPTTAREVAAVSHRDGKDSKLSSSLKRLRMDEKRGQPKLHRPYNHLQHCPKYDHHLLRPSQTIRRRGRSCRRGARPWIVGRETYQVAEDHKACSRKSIMLRPG